MNKIQINKYYEYKGKELSLRLESARQFFIKHMPSYGFSGEAILREFLSQNLPNRFKVSQGFVIDLGFNISKQCDIIIYDCLEHSPIAKYGEIEVVQNQAVKAVIEVKTSITCSSFNNALTYFEDLGNMGVNNKFLFIFNSVKPETIRNYFIGTKIEPNFDASIDSQPKYDHGSELYIPQGIVSLDKNYYYQLGFVSDTRGIPPEIAERFNDEGRDMIGYNAWQLAYINNKKISRLSSLQLFLADLSSSIGIQDDDESIGYESGIHMCSIHSFGLWDI